MPNMKQIKLFSLLIIAVCIFNSCKKKTYPESSVEGAPVFYFKGTVNNAAVDIESGMNNYYMYSSWVQDANNVYNLMGNIKSNNGSAQNSIQIQINDERVSASNAACIIDSALDNVYYPYKTGTAGCLEYIAQFYPKFDKGNSPQYNWNFGDGSNSSQSSPTHIFKRFKNYNVCLTASSSGSSCTSNLCNNYNSGLWGNNFNSGISVTNDSLTHVKFHHIPKGGMSPYSYFWDFGDGGSTSTLATPSYTYGGDGVYLVTLIVTDSLGNKATSYYNFATQNSLYCAINYSVVSATAVSNPKEFSNIIINWTDASGKQYTSNHTAQPADSYFQIISIEPYANNENGQPTKKVHVKFKCSVYEIGNTSNKITIDGGDAVIAVAYKL